jgi:D-serine dehydratase
MRRVIDGFCTIDDDELFRIEANLHDSAGINIEPSSAAGFTCPWRVLASARYRENAGLDEAAMSRSTHLAWVTGGSMVPRDEMAVYIARGKRLLR